MNINRRKSSNIKKYILASVMMLVILGLAYYWYLSQTNPQSLDSYDPVDYEAPSQDVINAGKDAKTDTVEEGQGKNTEQTSNSSESSNGASFTLDITTVLIENSEKLRVGSIISGLHSEGACKLTLTKGSQVITRSSDIQPLTDYTACAGFDVALSSGSWQVKLVVTIDGESVSKSTTVEVP